MEESQKEQINHPAHYNRYQIEAIDMMVEIFGVENTAMFCEMNAFKYRMRLGLKDDIHQDLAKEEWYLKRAVDLREHRVSVFENPYKNVF